MKTGIVKWFNDSKGYGFINTDTCKNVFVSWKDIVGEGFKTLAEGQAVHFNLMDTINGPIAKNVIKGFQSGVSNHDEECQHDERDHGICLDCEDDASDDIEACKKSRNE